ncbi:MAG: hypothetical protein JRF33_12085 [Deltaproteobacteria bacterium]|nr:hypothetical protein [Deltaproteobacteria bacterium]
MGNKIIVSLFIGLGLALVTAAQTEAAQKPPPTRVCVEVITQYTPPVVQIPATKQPAKDGLDALILKKTEPEPEPQADPEPGLWPGADFLPMGQTAESYLKRLMEHFITHEQGYAAVNDNCMQTLRVELYPLDVGWTVFARYSGHEREERVEKLHPDELSRFAERAVLALLHDAPISGSIKRDTVLRADSQRSTRTIKGAHHFLLGLGTKLRGGMFETALRDTNNADYGSTNNTLRLFFPMSLEMGYRGKFENWGIETKAILDIGTSKTASRHNVEGGHIDYGGGVGLQLHFLRYMNPRGLHSFYLGAGATFEFLWFSAIKADGLRENSDRSNLFGGGLDVDLIFGVEFMRASSVQFFLQGEFILPAYGLDNEDNHGRLHTWMPGLGIKLGMLF